MDLIDQQFDNVSQSLGIPDDQLKIVFCWVISLPLGFFMKFLKDPFIRNLYGLALGLFLQYLCIKEWLYLTLFATIFVFVLVKILDKKSDWASFAFLYALLLILHVYRFFTDYYGWRFDGTACLMVLLCKMTYFTFNYCDGKVAMPSFLEYMGYVYFFPSAIIGPVFNLQTYTNFIYLREQYSRIPSTILPCLKQVLYGITYLGALQVFEEYLKPQNVLYSEWYLELNWFLKTLVWHPCIVWVQIRYLGAWKFAQAGMNACGISYSGENKDTQQNEFDAVITVQDSYLIEWNPSMVIKKWNKSVQNWIGDVFYSRLSKKFKPQMTLLLVFTISGIWHGVHPMYFISFIHFAVYNDISKFFYKAAHKFAWVPSPIRFAFKWYAGKTAINYFGLGFYFLEVAVVYEIYKSVYLTFTIIPILLHVFFSVTQYGQRKRKPTTPGGDNKNEKPAENKKRD